MLPVIDVTLNPFVHHLELTTTYDKLKTGLFTLIILPIRLGLIAALLVLAWCLACVGLYGLNEEDLSEKPITGWRRELKDRICILGRKAYEAGGMHIHVKGCQASRREAPILVVAPHSTFLDAAIVYVTGYPSIICRRESQSNPWLGKLINFTQPVYVGRDDPDSRHKTVSDIIRRTRSNQDWPQVLIFPEGTCTNRSCLITFKLGAFYPGVPVQPVLIRYPNKMDTVTWTWDGPGALKLMWLTLTRAYSNCEIEFLPVYVPNEDEKNDPKLFAHNVRNVMARSLGIPTSDCTYEDCKAVKKAKDLQLPPSCLLISTLRLTARLGISKWKVEQVVKEKGAANWDIENGITLDEFTRIFDVSKLEEDLLIELHTLFPSEEDRIDLKKYLLATLLVTKCNTKEDMIELAFEVNGGLVRRNLFHYVTEIVYLMPKWYSEILFQNIATSRDGFPFISYENFKHYIEFFPDATSSRKWGTSFMNGIGKKQQ